MSTNARGGVMKSLIQSQNFADFAGRIAGMIPSGR